MQSGADQLKDWMRRRGFTQADAARYLEYSEPLISNIVKGLQKLGLKKAIHMERLTGIPVEAWATELADDDEADPASAGKPKVAKGKSHAAFG